MGVLAAVGVGRDQASRRQARLRELAIKFRHDGCLHQIFDFDPGQGAWVGACGVPYEGDAYVEASEPGDSTCMACIAESG